MVRAKKVRDGDERHCARSCGKKVVERECLLVMLWREGGRRWGERPEGDKKENEGRAYGDGREELDRTFLIPLQRKSAMA